MRHDQLIVAFEKKSEKLLAAATAVSGSKKKGRFAAYDMASDYLMLIEKHMNELVEFFKTTSVDEWLDKHFAPLAELGEPDWRELVTAIQRGMKKDQYVRDGVRKFMAEARKDSEPKQRKHEPLTEQVSRLHALVKELRADLKAALKRAMIAEATITKMKKMIEA